MLYRLRCGTIPLPQLYVAENKADAKLAESKGIPYIMKSRGMTDDLIIKLALLPTLKKLLPMIDWKKVLGFSRYRTLVVTVPGGECESGDRDPDAPDSGVADIADDYREFSGTDRTPDHNINLEDYVGDLSSQVNIEQLQDLYLLPAFVGEIADNITHNIYGNKLWSEGYNKKLKSCVGNFDQSYAKRNLIILDISGSIPRGISAMMLTLIETMRERVNADLIITGSTSMWFPLGSEMPSPKEIRRKIGLGNETETFMQILNDHVIGKEWGNVIAFGDNDRPINIVVYFQHYANAPDLGRTSVEHVWNYHTWAKGVTCGYALWVEQILGDVPQSYNTDWCEIMDDDYERRARGY
jgi:hypothetical protein